MKQEHGKIKWRFNLSFTTACGGCASVSGGSLAKLPEFGTVSKIFVQYYIPLPNNDRCHQIIEKSRLTFRNCAVNLQNSPFMCKLAFFTYFP